MVYRITCPNCKSMGKDRHGDNLAVYADGHKWCYSCSYYEPSSARDRITKQKLPEHPGTITLPEDASSEIDFLGMQWLAKYEITRDEIRSFRIKWSPSRKWLIFPVYSGDDTLLMFQAKIFGEGNTKYLTFGMPERVLNVLHQKKGVDDKGSVVLVEDVVSAIKVSRNFSALPLYGSFLSSSKLGRMQFSRMENLIFWLDYDKRKESLAIAQSAKVFGFKTSIIITGKDPKEYSDQEIIDIVTPSLTDQLPERTELLDQGEGCC